MQTIQTAKRTPIIWSQLELMAIDRLRKGARLSQTWANTPSLEKMVLAGLAKWDGHAIVVRTSR